MRLPLFCRRTMSIVLIVDADESSRALALHSLRELDLRIVDVAPNALGLIDSVSPDLVLLEMTPDAPALVRRLKDRSGDLFLPVIGTSATFDAESRKKALESGVDEFLAKPIEPGELALRVRNGLALRHKERALLQSNAELAELHRFKKEVFALLVHDLKSPLTVSIACIEHARALCRCGDEPQEALVDALRAGVRLKNLMGNMLDIDRLESARVTPTRVRFEARGWVDGIVAARRWEANAQEVSLRNETVAGTDLSADAGLLSRLLENLLDNALRYTPPGGHIVVSARHTPRQRCELLVANTGQPIPQEHRATIFEKYGQAQMASNTSNGGFGLYFCMLAAEAHGGTITLQETNAFPTMFVVDFPRDGGAVGLRARPQTHVPLGRSVLGAANAATTLDASPRSPR